MNNQIFYRNKALCTPETLAKRKSKKFSVEDLHKIISPPHFQLPINSKQPKRSKRHSNEVSYDFSSVERVEREASRKGKSRPTATMVSSMTRTRMNSSFKFVTLKQSNAVMCQKQSKLKKFKLYYQIGFGGFGRVWKVAQKLSMKEYAMKEISKRKVIEKNNVEPIMTQRRILSGLNHPFLINISCSFQDQDHLYLVMDYLRGGDLRYHICYKDCFSAKQIKFIAANIVLGLEYIHQNNIIHKDIKPENIVFQENGYVRITDFGIAKVHVDAQQVLPNNNESSGTPVYMAPEVLFKKDYSYESDYYALGVILFELVFRCRPYEGRNRNQIRDKMLQKELSIAPKDIPLGNVPYLAEFISGLLRIDPQLRLGRKGSHQLKDHPYFADMKWKKLLLKQVKPPFIPSVICETKEYLEEINLFNDINEENDENLRPIDRSVDELFRDYDYDKGLIKKRKLLKKVKRSSQKRLNNY